MQSQGIHSAAGPQAGKPINFTDFAELPDVHARPARRKARPKINRLPIRVGNMKRMLANRYGPHLPDTDDARHDLLPHVHHLVLLRGPDRARREASRLLPELTDAEVAGMILDSCWWDDDELGVYLDLSDADRTRLKITAIGACDCLRPERLKRRRWNRRDADRKRRAAAGAKPQAQSAVRTRPWEAEGVSKATYYRRLKAARETGETTSRPASLRDAAARAVSPAAPAVEASHHIDTDRAAREADPGKASPPTAPIDTTRADSLKGASRGEVSDGPVQAIGTTDADLAARLDYRRRREAWDLKCRQRAVIAAARLREGIEIGPGEKILLCRVEKERQARAKVARPQQEAELQASPIYQRWMARKHAATVEAVEAGLLPASVLEGRAA